MRDDGVGRQAGEEVPERGLEVLGLLRLERHAHLVLGVRELGVRAAHEIREAPQHGVQMLGERSLAHPEEDDPHEVRALAEPLLDRVELAAEDLRDAREHVDVAHHDHGTIRWSEARSSGPSGTSAILSRASLIRDWYTSSSAATRLGSRTTRRPNARATPAMVTSSCVGPTPPEVNTQS